MEGAIARATAGRHGVAKLTHLLDAGLGVRTVQRLAASGRLHRLYVSVYSTVPPNLLTRHARFLAAVFAAGEGAVLSHHSAAALLGIRPSARAKIDVTVPSRSRRTIAGVNVHRSNTLTAADTTVVDGIPTTTAARALLDLAAGLDRRGLEKAFDQAEILELFDLTAIHDELERNRTARGAPRVKALWPSTTRRPRSPAASSRSASSPSSVAPASRPPSSTPSSSCRTTARRSRATSSGAPSASSSRSTGTARTGLAGRSSATATATSG